MTQPERSDVSAEYARRAAEVVTKLKTGSYESAQALALTSIAHSLSRIAQALESR